MANFLAVPLTVKYLGAERYGVWVTLTSILAYLNVLDLGIGSTALNRISDALAKENFPSARQQINTAYWALLGIAIIFAVGISAAWPLISWSAVLGDKAGVHAREVTLAAGTAIAVVLASFPLSATPRIMGACNKVTLSNYLLSLGSVLSLVAVFVATRMKAGLPGLVLAVSGSTLVVSVFATAWLFRHFDAWLTLDLRDLQWSRTRALLTTGLPFFAVQLAGVVLFQTDNVIIAQTLGAASVTPYSITWKLFSYAYLLQVLALPSLWPAYADAFARRNIAWVRTTYRYNILIALGSTTMFVLLLLFFGKRFIAVWAGPAAVPSTGLIVGMAVWTIISALSWCQSCLLGAAGRVKGQAIYSGIGAVVNVVASIILGRMFGLIGIIMGTLIAYVFCIIVPQTLEVRSVLRKSYA